MSASTINNKYVSACNTPSDIFMHLPFLQHLASKSDVVAEFGVRGCVSTWAFLSGLSAAVSSGDKKEKKLYCLDIEDIDMTEVIAAAAAVDVVASFIKEDSAKVVLPEPVDLLFIDTWHIYGHLKRELAMHHTNVRKYIAMHDTEVDGINGESVRLGLDVEAQAKATGYSPEEIRKGLKLAVDEFLAAHGDEWVMTNHFADNNGLTVLTRRSALTATA